MPCRRASYSAEAKVCQLRSESFSSFCLFVPIAHRHKQTIGTMVNSNLWAIRTIKLPSMRTSTLPVLIHLLSQAPLVVLKLDSHTVPVRNLPTAFECSSRLGQNSLRCPLPGSHAQSLAVLDHSRGSKPFAATCGLTFPESFSLSVQEGHKASMGQQSRARTGMLMSSKG